eukprot:1922701-Pyramimonas_sp.AAC.1
MPYGKLICLVGQIALTWISCPREQKRGSGASSVPCKPAPLNGGEVFGRAERFGKHSQGDWQNDRYTPDSKAYSPIAR